MKKVLVMCLAAVLIFALPTKSIAQDDGDADLKSCKAKTEMCKVTSQEVQAPALVFTMVEQPVCNDVFKAADATNFDAVSIKTEDVKNSIRYSYHYPIISNIKVTKLFAQNSIKVANWKFNSRMNC